MCFWSDQNILGTQNSGKGISPDPENAKAIKDTKSKQDLQRFLGMIPYLSIPQLSEQTHHLRELVQENSIWDFTVTHRN